MSYGVQVSGPSGLVTLSDQTLGGRVYVGEVVRSAEAVNTVSTYTFPNAGAAANIKVFEESKAHNYALTSSGSTLTVTLTARAARKNDFTFAPHYPGTRMKLFSTNTGENTGDYGVQISNASGEMLASLVSSVPSLCGAIDTTSATYTSAYGVTTYSGTCSLNLPPDKAIVFWQLPDHGTNAWWGTDLYLAWDAAISAYRYSFKAKFAGGLTAATAIPPRILVFSPVLPATPPEPYGIALWNASGVLTYSSALPHLAIAGFESLAFSQTVDTVTTTTPASMSSFAATAAVFSPGAMYETVTNASGGVQLATYRRYESFIARGGASLYTKLSQTLTLTEDVASPYPGAWYTGATTSALAVIINGANY